LKLFPPFRIYTLALGLRGLQLRLKSATSPRISITNLINFINFINKLSKVGRVFSFGRGVKSDFIRE
jgi:hypothetical protein